MTQYLTILHADINDFRLYGVTMNSPKEFLENNSHEEISRCIVHQLTQRESPIGAILKTTYGYFWLDFRNEIYSNTFFRTLRETISEFNLWIETEKVSPQGSPN